MEELRKDVLEAMEKELERANKQFPLFNSSHEGLSVIREELHETYDEVDSVTEIVEDMEKAVFKNKPNDFKRTIAKQGAIAALSGACELIQVAAMFDKFITSMDKKCGRDEPSEFMRMPQEELNKIVDKLFDGESVTAIGHKTIRLTPEQGDKVLAFLKELEAENEH